MVTRNEEGKDVLIFALAYDLVIASTYFKKRDSHIITYISGGNHSQINFILPKKRDRTTCKDGKIIPGKVMTTQHRLVILNVKLKSRVKKKKTICKQPQIRWSTLKGVNN